MAGVSKHYMLSDGIKYYVDHQALNFLNRYIQIVAPMPASWRKKLLLLWGTVKAQGRTGGLELIEYRVRPGASQRRCRWRSLVSSCRKFRPKKKAPAAAPGFFVPGNAPVEPEFHFHIPGAAGRVPWDEEVLPAQPPAQPPPQLNDNWLHQFQVQAAAIPQANAVPRANAVVRPRNVVAPMTAEQRRRHVRDLARRPAILANEAANRGRRG